MNDGMTSEELAEFFETPENWVELGQAEKELNRQDELWGDQSHLPDVEPVSSGWVQRLVYKNLADGWKETNAQRVADGTIAWDGILLEEVFEALSEEDPVKQYEEFVQVAAVALQWAGAIRRRGESAGRTR